MTNETSKCGKANCGAAVIRATGPMGAPFDLHPVPSPRGKVIAWRTAEGWQCKVYMGQPLTEGQARYRFHLPTCAATKPVRDAMAGRAHQARAQRGRPRATGPFDGATGARAGGGR